MYFAHDCKKLNGEDKQGECFRKLCTTIMFSCKIEINRLVRFVLNETKKEADKYLQGDKMIIFVNTKIACEVNDNK